jgi:hypothetical protein
VVLAVGQLGVGVQVAPHVDGVVEACVDQGAQVLGGDGGGGHARQCAVAGGTLAFGRTPAANAGVGVLPRTAHVNNVA